MRTGANDRVRGALVPGHRHRHEPVAHVHSPDELVGGDDDHLAAAVVGGPDLRGAAVQRGREPHDARGGAALRGHLSLLRAALRPRRRRRADRRGSRFCTN